MYVPGDPLRVLLGHPGGPYWRGKDAGVWSIPKGLPAPGEDRLTAAQREFFEETGLEPSPPFLPLNPIKQKSGKRVYCWAFAGCEAAIGVGASTFEIEWPPKSGKRASFPEIDELRLLAIEDAHAKILPAQAPLLDELEGLLAAR
jgi:predicted NUDIX family NTP pyrophosphohydrolase